MPSAHQQRAFFNSTALKKAKIFHRVFRKRDDFVFKSKPLTDNCLRSNLFKAVFKAVLRVLFWSGA